MSDFDARGMFTRLGPKARTGESRRLELLRELGWVGVLPLLVLLTLILYTTRGQFVYSFDDPYIHLALARNIWLGHYGINLSEASAPSSSVLWPFLLAPFSAAGSLFEFVPLILNCGFLLAFAFVVGRTFDDIEPRYRTALVFAIAFWVNAYGLVFSGMEHSLQLLLVAMAFRPHLERPGFPERRVELPQHVFVVLILLPLVRYEDLAISVPLLLLAARRGQWRPAVVAMGVITVSLGGFSLFLYRHGLGFLPSSVVAKEGMTSGLGLGWNVLVNIVLSPGLLVVSGYLAHACWRRDRAWSILLLTVCVLHLLFGKSGTFGRYTAYVSLMMALCGVRLLIDRSQFWRGVIAAPLLGCALAFATVMTPVASSNIEHQQAQMAEIVHALHEPVAANDIGLVTLRGEQYVLDLWGLGSRNALRYRLGNADPMWMSDLMRRNGVHYAIIYDAWFPNRPAAFQLVGKMKLQGYRVSAASDVVSFYAIDANSAEKLKRTLVGYAQLHRDSGSVLEID